MKQGITGVLLTAIFLILAGCGTNIMKGDIFMIKILIVEDEHPISDLIRMNLEDAGYHCTCFTFVETS